MGKPKHGCVVTLVGDRAAAQDEQWFKEHPRATWRYREAIRGEIQEMAENMGEAPPVDVAHVFVVAISSGMRMRMPSRLVARVKRAAVARAIRNELLRRVLEKATPAGQA